MGRTQGDDRTEPTLELPSLKLGLRRRKKAERADPGPPPVEDPTPPDVPVDEPVPELAPEHTPEPEPDPAHEPEPAPAAETEPPRQPAAPAPGRSRAESPGERTTPRLPGRLAALLTGVLVGLAAVAATYAALRGCEAVRGVSTCGEGPGFFILVAIFVLMVLLGSVLLKALGVADSTSTSFLAVGIVTVLTMLILLDDIDSRSMLVAVPVLSAGAYVLAHWVTTRFEHEDTGRRDWT